VPRVPAVFVKLPELPFAMWEYCAVAGGGYCSPYQKQSSRGHWHCDARVSWKHLDNVWILEPGSHCWKQPDPVTTLSFRNVASRLISGV